MGGKSDAYGIRASLHRVLGSIFTGSLCRLFTKCKKRKEKIMEEYRIDKNVPVKEKRGAPKAVRETTRKDINNCINLWTSLSLISLRLLEKCLRGRQ
jgi:hypothetical protein